MDDGADGAGLRETLSVYSTHGVRVQDEAAAAAASGSPAHGGRRSCSCSELSLVLGYFVAGASTLYVEYNHASTLGANPQSPINAAAVIGTPESMLSFTRNLSRAVRRVRRATARSATWRSARA